MRPSAILVILLLVVGVIACGCTSRTDYQYEGGSSAGTAAKYSPGDIVQSEEINKEFGERGGVLITEIRGDQYVFVAVLRESTNSAWRWGSGNLSTYPFEVVEEAFPHKIGHVDPGSLITTTTPTKVTGRDRLQILTHDIEYSGYGGIYVVGTAKNIGDERISWGSIEVKFYDRQGNLVGNGADMIQDLDPGETWKFRAMYFDVDGAVDSYKIGVGSTW
ncbi:FxLYD domain-containing protein [Methanoculleus sp.]|jgi:hypothetical protein|uniref:FxLYD domain-containing protein n=1 Tax=Methanoculleus sp. TaxID=90427 RepID=UPI001BD63C25|nr:FxLYD domain-containing protein [Methanoculleus sp.]